MPIVAYKIKWDTDGAKVDLPKRVEIPPNITDPDEISDYLSNLTGFCHNGFMLRDVQDMEREKKKHANPRVDRYYDLTCDSCARSRSSDFEKGMETDGKVALACAYAEGWRKIKKMTLCPDCAAAAEKERSKP